MPSLFRFLLVAGVLGALVFGGLYAMQPSSSPSQGDGARPCRASRCAASCPANIEIIEN